MSEQVVGFDAREMWLEFPDSWPAGRIDGFLYRLDIAKPLSTDQWVWPSVFGPESVPRPPACFGHQDCWDCLDVLREHVDRSKRCCLIAITQHGELPIAIPPATPSVRSPEWRFLGYDVSDTWLLSGLANCGFLAGHDDVGALRNHWGPHLNRFHLFDEMDTADRFRELSDHRIREHAPFHVFGLWLIEGDVSKLRP